MAKASKPTPGQPLQIEQVAVSALIPYARNSRTHSDAQVAQIAASIKEFGFTNPVLIDKDGGIIAGHGRVMAARKLKLDEVPCIRLEHLTDTQKRAYIIADNKLALNAGWDAEALQIELAELDVAGFKLDLTGFDGDDLTRAMFGELAVDGAPDGGKDTEQQEADEQDAGQEQKQAEQSAKLADEFGAAPFSVLDTRKGEWLDKKRVWRDAIGDDGESRENTLFTSSGDDVSNKLQDFAGVSILDPVMAELMVRWFGTPGGVAFDPFAGDSVFGFVSAKLGMKFKGIELRKEQVDLNQTRVNDAGLDAIYYNDTSENMSAYIKDGECDMIFTCPPYADLEIYSNDPRDLSTMGHNQFFEVYAKILAQTFGKLKNNRFAVVVMGEVRGKDGGYIGTIPKTISIMERAGYTYYNEMIIVNTAGTLALRAGRQMRATRKIGKMHQNILVFLKGSAKVAAQELGDIKIPESAGNE
jgi:ParB-like chromosome segregation protein Spo0J/DNA modification methylase